MIRGPLEFFETESKFTYFDLLGEEKSLELPPGSLAFTICQVPIVYRLCDGPLSIDVTFANGDIASIAQDCLDPESSLALFQRNGKIARIDVELPEEQIVRA